MDRSKSQVLFNFSQENTFDHSDNGSIAKITEINGDFSDSLPQTFIINRIKPLLNLWENEPELRAGSTDFVDPQRVHFEIFPKSFKCHNDECGNVTKLNQAENFDGSLNCDYCGEKLNASNQIPLVTVCKCGQLSTIDIPSCSRCGSNRLCFIQKGSSLIEAKWKCLECGYDEGDVVAFNCRVCGEGKKLKVHSSSTCYYAQSENFVNVEEGLDRIITDSDYKIEQILDYLVSKDNSSENNIQDQLDAKIEEALNHGEEEKADEMKQAKEKFISQYGEVEKTVEERRNEKKKWIKENFTDSEIRELSQELYEYNSIEEESEETSNTLDELYDNAEENRDIRIGEIAKAREKRDELNIDTVKVMEDFPITTVVYGYTRLSSRPKEGVNLNTFHGSNGNTKLFIQRTNTEAVLVKLDKQKVIDWLVENEVINQKPQGNLNEWFLRKLQDYPHYDEIDPSDPPIDRYCLNLLHSISHTMVNSVGALSGYSKESLIEYVMPHTMSFVIYKRSETEFNLGALMSIIEDRFRQLATHMLEESKTCVYDPVCERDENASCEGCLYLSSMSCINGNKSLSRSTLFGGSFYGEEIEGYFNV
jgi:hypothetical protein